jgi:hypothetical protein
MFETELRREEELDRFVVRTDEADVRAALVQFGFEENGEQEYTRSFPSSPDAPIFFERFTACARELFAQFSGSVAHPGSRASNISTVCSQPPTSTGFSVGASRWPFAESRWRLGTSTSSSPRWRRRRGRSDTF